MDQGNENNQTDAIIIGAGAAGIGASVQLKKNNLKIKILQARKCVGGRVQSKQIDKINIDLGASFIHSYNKSNPISTYIKKLKIQQNVLSKRNIGRVYMDGQEAKQFQDHVLETAYSNSMYFYRFAQKNIAKSQQDMSLQAACKQFIQNSIEKFNQKQKRCTKLLLNMVQHYEGSSLKQISTTYYEYRKDEGGDFIPDGGYGQLLAKIASSNNLKVEFEKVVTRIAYGANKVEVTCRDGSVYRAKKVVCSLPLGVLKSGKVSFEPQLPPAYLESIGRLGVALMNKIIVAFEENFWGSMSWISVGCNERGRFSQIYNFSQKGKHILCCFITDDFARKVEPLPDEELLGEFVALLGRLFKKEGIKVTDYAITRWGLDEFSLGSYTSFHVGSSPDDSYRLRKPVGDTLWIVGEHCYPQHIGTAHGAFKTGIYAAQQIMKSLKWVNPIFKQPRNFNNKQKIGNKN